LPGLAGLVTTTDHKTIGRLTVGTGIFLLFGFGALAMIMRAQLTQPGLDVVGPRTYDQLFTMHGSGMIFLVVTPIAIGYGVYLVPLQVGAPFIAAPRVAALGYWLYLGGALAILSSFMAGGGAASGGWFAYTPLTDRFFTPGKGMDIWIAGSFVAAVGMILLAATVLWTALRLRAPEMTLLRMPVFTWSMIVTCMMVIASFPSLLGAMTLLAIGRYDPSVFNLDVWNIGYQNLFWFYGHPVVYVMFFPFVGCVAEVISTFAGRRYVGYKPTVLSLLAFAGLSMSVWGHHMFTTGQVANDYYSLTSITLSIPAGLEYFGFLSTLIGGALVYRTPLLFALAFIPQFLIGGITGIMLGTPVIDYHVEDSYFVVAHFHYTLMAGSVFGLFAGFYFWFPKATGLSLREGLGKIHFFLLTLGVNTTFLPMFGLGLLGMPRRMATYPPGAGFTTLNMVSTIGAGIIALAMTAFALNLVISLTKRRPAPSDPWCGMTLEWSTTSPPPPHNYFSLPPVKSYAPLLDLREEAAKKEKERSSSQAAVPADAVDIAEGGGPGPVEIARGQGSDGDERPSGGRGPDSGPDGGGPDV
jgi:cytochrome c oxidase subunit 1